MTLKVGDRVKIIAPADPWSDLVGVITHIESTTRTLPLTIHFPHLEAHMANAMFAYFEVQLVESVPRVQITMRRKNV